LEKEKEKVWYGLIQRSTGTDWYNVSPCLYIHNFYDAVLHLSFGMSIGMKTVLGSM